MNFCNVRVAESMLNSKYSRFLILRAFIFRHFIYCVAFTALNLRRPTNETIVSINSVDALFTFRIYVFVNGKYKHFGWKCCLTQFRFRCGSETGRKVITLMHTAHGVASLFPKHRYLVSWLWDSIHWIWHLLVSFDILGFLFVKRKLCSRPKNFH